MSDKKNEKKEEKNNGKTFVVGSLLAFLFSNVLLFVYGLFKTLDKKRKK